MEPFGNEGSGQYMREHVRTPIGGRETVGKEAQRVCNRLRYPAPALAETGRGDLPSRRIRDPERAQPVKHPMPILGAVTDADTVLKCSARRECWSEDYL